MKKELPSIIKGLILVLSALIFVVLIAYLLIFNTTHVNSVTVDGKAVDNSYNNAVANNEYELFSKLARIDNKLYYNANESMFKYGTYEISNGFTKRIFWKGISITPSYLNLDVVGDGNLLLNKNQGEVDFYNFEKNKYELFTQIDNSIKQSKQGERVYYRTFYIDDELYWYVGDDPMGIDTHYDIYTSIAGKMKSIFSTSSIDKCCFSAPSFSNGYMYIQTINDSENGGDNYLYKYDMKNGVIVQKVKINNYGNYNIVSNDNVYTLSFSDFKDENKHLIVTNINANNQKDIFNTSGSAVINGYNNLLCLGVYDDSIKKGLYVIDNKTNQIKKIYDDSEVFSVYIVDDKWIYFTDENERLYRITPDGKTLEKIFG